MTAAMCCKCILLEGGIGLAEVQAMARTSFLGALGGDPLDRGNLQFLTGLVELPARLEDWPEDSRSIRVGHDGDLTPGVAYFRCRYLGDDDLCTVYDRRPGTCRSFEATEGNGCERCASFGTTCHPPVQVQVPDDQVKDEAAFDE